MRLPHVGHRREGFFSPGGTVRENPHPQKAVVDPFGAEGGGPLALIIATGTAL
jgi:hypothetical protein